MSTTPVSDPKISQMLDSGWCVDIFKNGLGTYTATATTENKEAWLRARSKWVDGLSKAWPNDPEICEQFADNDFEQNGDNKFCVETEDHTPTQTLTRLAYKVHGEYLECEDEAGKMGGEG